MHQNSELVHNMEISRKDLQKTYSAISDEELLDIYYSGAITEIAHGMIVEELKRRDIPIHSKPETKVENSAAKSRGNMIKNIFVWLFTIIGVLMIKIGVDIYSHPNRQERLNNAVNNAIQTINSKNNDGAEKGIQEIVETLKETSRSINKQLPMMVDPDTRLDITISHGMQQHYKYTMINYSKDDLNEQSFHKNTKIVISNSQCNNDDMKLMLNTGVEYFYHVFDEDGLHITTVKINRNDCE